MPNPTLCHEGSLFSPQVPDNHNLTQVRYAQDTLILSESGRELVLRNGEPLAFDSIRKYGQAALGRASLANCGCRQPLRKRGRDGAIYRFAPGSKVIVKEIDQKLEPMFGDRTYPLYHMEDLRLTIKASGNAWLGVPCHYALFCPKASDRPLYLSQQEIVGVSAWSILNTPEKVSPEYRRLAPSLLDAMPLAEAIIRRTLQGSGSSFDLEMQDWGPHNILTEIMPSTPPFGYKLWIVDQVAY